MSELVTQSIQVVKQIPRKRALLVFVTLIVVVLMAIPVFWVYRRESVGERVWIDNEMYVLESADTEALRQKGLGGRGTLCETCGMLFVFDRPDRYAFWMKDMRFPLTVIWLAGEQVVFIARDVAPDFPGVISPPVPADRVIEINAGRARALNHGDQVRFSSDE